MKRISAPTQRLEADPSLPRGYIRTREGTATIVGRADVFDAVRAAFRAAPSDRPTLHGYASHDMSARAFQGRGIAYGLILPGTDMSVVVRHNQHGGLFRAITRDLFSGKTRAPMELDASLKLVKLGVPTPPVLAYAIYPAVAGLSRCDVITEEIGHSMDLGEALVRTSPESDERRKAWNATLRLLRRLAAAGVRHHDLNVKNVLLQPTLGHVLSAYALDVDRVEFNCARRDAFAGNRARLRRSVEKWRSIHGATVSDEEIAAIGGVYLTPDERTTSL